MLAALVIVILFVLMYKTLEDIHDSVVIATRFNPEVKLNHIQRFAYNLFENRK